MPALHEGRSAPAPGKAALPPGCIVDAVTGTCSHGHAHLHAVSSQTRARDQDFNAVQGKSKGVCNQQAAWHGWHWD